MANHPAVPQNHPWRLIEPGSTIASAGLTACRRGLGRRVLPLSRQDYRKTGRVSLWLVQ